MQYNLFMVVASTLTLSVYASGFLKGPIEMKLKKVEMLVDVLQPAQKPAKKNSGWFKNLLGSKKKPAPKMEWVQTSKPDLHVMRYVFIFDDRLEIHKTIRKSARSLDHTLLFEDIRIDQMESEDDYKRKDFDKYYKGFHVECKNPQRKFEFAFKEEKDRQPVRNAIKMSNGKKLNSQQYMKVMEQWESLRKKLKKSKPVQSKDELDVGMAPQQTDAPGVNLDDSEEKIADASKNTVTAQRRSSKSVSGSDASLPTGAAASRVDVPLNPLKPILFLEPELSASATKSDSGPVSNIAIVQPPSVKDLTKLQDNDAVPASGPVETQPMPLEADEEKIQQPLTPQPDSPTTEDNGIDNRSIFEIFRTSGKEIEFRSSGWSMGQLKNKYEKAGVWRQTNKKTGEFNDDGKIKDDTPFEKFQFQ